MIYRGYLYCRIDGKTGGYDRDSFVDSFNKPVSDKLIFLLSTRAVRLGNNLAAADTIILYHRDRYSYYSGKQARLRKRHP